MKLAKTQMNGHLTRYWFSLDNPRIFIDRDTHNDAWGRYEVWLSGGAVNWQGRPMALSIGYAQRLADAIAIAQAFTMEAHP
jgi:hypothetical protein